jgi:Tol biopolymer transport system component
MRRSHIIYSKPPAAPAYLTFFLAGSRKTLFFLLCVILYGVFGPGCKKDGGACAGPFVVPVSPYSSPVWYPDGTMLGFNHLPLQSVTTHPDGDCSPWYSYSYYADSDGFWLVNRDGTGMHRLTSFELEHPAWSPDGKWIAFSFGGQIFKMPFNGVSFDTTTMVQLTTDPSSHFNPAWNLSGDSLFYDSDEQDVSRPYHVYRMAADGTGQQNIGNMGMGSTYSREPFYTPSSTLLHIRGDTLSTHVFVMNPDGTQVRQITRNISPHIYIHHPSSYASKVYYEDYGIWSANMDGSALMEIVPNSTQGYSISKDGLVAYINLDLTDHSPDAVLDATHGVIWIMNVDGSNRHQLTFNNHF